MEKRDKSEGGNEDIRIALKMPGRGSMEVRQISSTFKKIKAALRTSSGGGGGRSGISTRQRGAAAAGTASKSAMAGRASGVAAKPLQRVSVRVTYASNKGDGQWGAHGRYIERESAGREVEQEISGIERDLDPSINPSEKELKNERDPSESRDGIDRYSNPVALNNPGRVATLRESYAREIGRAPEAKSLNDLRSLSSVGVVKWQGRNQGVLSGNAPDHLVERRAERDDVLRRGSYGQSRTAGGAGRRLGGFGSGGDAVSIASTLNGWQQAGDDRIFKMIVSPEFGDKMDLRQHTRELVAQMEKDLGTKLQWVAADHYNTDNPHVHLTIRGVDDRGQQLEISPQYIKEGARIRAQEGATRQLGYRTDHDVAEALDRQVNQQRFTDLDRTLLKSANEQGDPNIDLSIIKAARTNSRMEMDFSQRAPSDPKLQAERLKQVKRLAALETMGLAQRIGTMKWRVSADLGRIKTTETRLINLAGLLPPGEKARSTRLLQIRRLTQLTQMGLAEKVGDMAWRLNPSMESALRQMQMSQDRLKTKFAHREMISDPSAQLVTSQLKELGQRVSGKLVGTGLDEQTNRPYMLIEGFDGKVHYVSQSAKVQQMRGDGSLKAGDFVSLEVVSRKDRGGQVIGDMVRIQNYGRTLGPEALDKEILSSSRAPERITTRKSVAGAFLDAAANRMDRLQQAGVIEVNQGQIRELSVLAHDKVRFEDAGIKVERFEGKGPMLATVLAKGRESFAIQTEHGERLFLTANQLSALGIGSKYVGRDATLFVGVNHKGEPYAAVIKPDRVPAMIKDLRTNHLDSMAQQLQGLPADHPIAVAIKQRGEVWRERGVDPKDEKFPLRANVWRKGIELHEAAQQKGVDVVLEELSRDRGKPTREMQCEPGRQISGRVVLVNKQADHTMVVVDTGGELTIVRQPISSEADLKAGQRIRARSAEINDQNLQSRMMTWRFADLEREEALNKGRQGKSF